MPTYSFKNVDTGEVHDMILSYDAKVQYLKDNPIMKSVITQAPTFNYNGIGTHLKVSDSHREAVARVKENCAINNINDH